MLSDLSLPDPVRRRLWPRNRGNLANVGRGDAVANDAETTVTLTDAPDADAIEVIAGGLRL